MIVTLEGQYRDSTELGERTLNQDYSHMTVPQFKDNLIQRWNLDEKYLYQYRDSLEVKFESAESGCTYSESFTYYGETLSP